MRNIVLIAIILALAVAAISHESGTKTDSSTSTEKTTSNGFLAAQHKYDRMWGDRATDDELMTVGRTICALRKRGMSDSDILKNTAGYPLPAGKARTLGLQRIRDAKKYLCP